MLIYEFCCRMYALSASWTNNILAEKFCCTVAAHGTYLHSVSIYLFLDDVLTVNCTKYTIIIIKTDKQPFETKFFFSGGNSQTLERKEKKIRSYRKVELLQAQAHLSLFLYVQQKIRCLVFSSCPELFKIYYRFKPFPEQNTILFWAAFFLLFGFVCKKNFKQIHDKPKKVRYLGCNNGSLIMNKKRRRKLFFLCSLERTNNRPY